MLAARLGLPAVTYASQFDVADGSVTAVRDGDASSRTVSASLPALVSVTDQTSEPRYPSFKGIMAAKKKPVETWSLADLGVDAGDVGQPAAWTEVADITARPPRQAGTVITDEGDGGAQLAAFLRSHKFA